MLSMLSDRIAVIPVEDPDKIGSLYIPNTAKRRVDQGIVKYRGDDVKEIRVGDHVCFSGYTGTKITVKDEGTLIVMKEEDVIALIGEAEELFTINQIKRAYHDALEEYEKRRSNWNYYPQVEFEELFFNLFENTYERGLEF